MSETTPEAEPETVEVVDDRNPRTREAVKELDETLAIVAAEILGG